MINDERIEKELIRIEADLKDLFGCSFEVERWKEYQEPVMKAILKENCNELAILPTATGKSILFQYFALFKHEAGIVLVIEPLQSIIKDQIQAFNNLGKKTGIRRKAGTIAEYLKDSKNIPKDISIVYLNPELLYRYSNQLTNLVRDNKVMIQMVVIDELHTMFEWGSSFRSEFLYIPVFVNKMKAANIAQNKELKVLSLTATLNNSEMELCRYLLNTDSKEIIETAPIIERNITIEPVKNNKISGTYDPLIKILDGSSAKKRRLTQGIAFFKEKKYITAFIKRFDLLTETQPGYKKIKGIQEDSIYDYKIEVPLEKQYKDYYKRRLVEFSGEKKTEDKEHLLERINNSNRDDFRVYVLATKALAMGVDLRSITDIQIIGIPESWNCFLQEIGRVRKNGGTYRAFYWPSDALQMFIKLVESEKKNPNCFYDPFVNVMERIKAWDFLCLWEWYVDSIKYKKGNPNGVPYGVDITLEELLQKRPADIRKKLKRIIELDSNINEEHIKDHNFDEIYKNKISIDDLKQQPLININRSKAFISFGNKDYPGIFNGGRARIADGEVSWILKADTPLSFIDYMVFNALCTCCSYSIEGINDDKNSILKLLLGLGSSSIDLSEDEHYQDLLEYVERSLNRIKNTQIEYYKYVMTEGSGLIKSRIKTVELYANGTFPIFNAFPELQYQVGVVETAKVKYLFDSIKGRGPNLTAVNIIAIFYTLFGIERHKQIYGVTGRKGHYFNVFKLPYKAQTIDSALTDWFDLFEDDGKKKNRSQEYDRLIEKMQKITILKYFPKIDPKDNELSKQKHDEIIKKIDTKLKPESPEETGTEKQKRRWEKWEKDKAEKLVLYVKPKSDSKHVKKKKKSSGNNTAE